MVWWAVAPLYPRSRVQDKTSLTATVVNGRFGVMPAWGEKWRVGTGLDQAEINAVAAYVHQLGGGE